MKSSAIGLGLIISGFPVFACGPWFPDTVLDNPRFALQVPPVCYEAEIAALFPNRKAPAEAPAVANDDVAAAIENKGSDLLLRQIPRELGELQDWWKKKGLNDEEISRRSKAYVDLRVRQLSAIGNVAFKEFEVAEPDAANGIAERPLADILPPDVADFVEASRLVIVGRPGEARTIWQSILDRPAEEKKFRAAWAAWMLAKTGEDWIDAEKWYLRVREEVAAGAYDCISLGPDAAGWLGPRQEDPIQGLKLLAQAWCEGRKEALIDIRRLAQDLLEKATPEELAALARDPLARQILNIEVFTTLDSGWNDAAIDPSEPFPYANWLAAIENYGGGQIERAEQIAWALYSRGHYDASRAWLARAEPGTERVLWLKAKFALMDGRSSQADRALERAVTIAKRSPDWKASNPLLDETSWLDSDERHSATNGHLLADAAVLDLSRGEYSSALARFTEAGYWSDAAYIAERVLTTDELVDHVNRHAPKWSENLTAYWEGKRLGNPEPDDINAGALQPVPELELEDNPKPEDIKADAKQMPDMWNFTDQFDTKDRLRYLLGRRLTREFRFREARAYMPKPMLPLYDHYVALHRAGISGEYTATEKIAILWNEAAILREFGLVMIGTEGAPDGFERWGSFPAINYFFLRSRRDGWKNWWDYEEESANPPALKEKLEPHQVANPRVSMGEIERARSHAVVPNLRYHYRYRAADIAWKAAELAPDNSNTKVHILNTAGKWLASRDPIAADRFYKAMVRRNWSHPLGQTADKNRWFISMDVPPDLPQLPEKLRPK
ncbi:MAG: hypothetical protein ACKO2G_05760 [Verrucomicrobiales bacterium]